MKNWNEDLIVKLIVMMYSFVYVSIMTWLICCVLGVECTIRITSAAFIVYLMVHSASYWSK